MTRKKVLITLAVLLMLPLFLMGSKTIRLTTLEWEPYIGKGLPDQGFVHEIVTEAFKREGYTVQIDYYPWVRAVRMSDDGVVDGYFPEYYAQSREEFALFSEPFKGGPVGFFKLKSNNISWKSLDDLRPYSIGTVRDYVNEEKFDATDFLKKDEVNDDETNFRKLFGKRIDLVVADRFVGEYLVRNKMPNNLPELEFLEPPLIEHSLFVCISKKAADADAKLKAFNNGLASMKKDGTYDKILIKHNIAR